MVVFIVVPKNRGLQRYKEIALEYLTDKSNIMEVRGEDIPFWIEQLQKKGKKAIGLTGEDLYREYVFEERSPALSVLKRIDWQDPKAKFGRPCLCLLGPKGKTIDDCSKDLTVAIAPKYKKIAKKYLNFLERKGYKFQKIYVNGSVETSCSQGISDLVIDIVYSGRTLEENNLSVYDKILESNFVIIASKTSIEPREEVTQMREDDPPTSSRKGKLRLDFNENTIGCSPKVIQAIQNIKADELSIYPDYNSLRIKLAKYLNLTTNEVIPSNGTDEAIKKYKKFDNVELDSFELTKDQMTAAYNEVDDLTINSLKGAAKQIKSFAEAQLKSIKPFEINQEDCILGQKIIPVQRVGCYVPGGNYPLPSSALMTIIPAKVAGVKEVIVCSPKIKPVTIVAADLAGADRIFSVGGIQAISAMAYGTESLPKVDKIVGPGNKYVTAAKKEVFGDVGIDFIAGPSEVLIIADDSGNPCYIAADLLAQAEHDVDAKPILLTTSQKLADDVKAELDKQLETLRTKEIAKKALNNGYIKVVSSIKKAIEINNNIAPEHLEIQFNDMEKYMDQFTNYRLPASS